MCWSTCFCVTNELYCGECVYRLVITVLELQLNCLNIVKTAVLHPLNRVKTAVLHPVNRVKTAVLDCTMNKSHTKNPNSGVWSVCDQTVECGVYVIRQYTVHFF